jgi:hypothetical protein
MTQKNNEDNGNGLIALIGLAKQAYTGAPKGVAQVSLTNPELRVKKTNWALKTKLQRRKEIIDNL